MLLIFKEEEEVPVTSLHYYDNKLAVDHLMSKPHGLFYLIDDATRGRQSQEYITGKNSKFYPKKYKWEEVTTVPKTL